MPLPNLGANLYPLLPIRLLAHIRYDTQARPPKIACLMLVIHSCNDDIIPYADG